MLALLHVSIINQETASPEEELGIFDELRLVFGSVFDGLPYFVEADHCFEAVTDELYRFIAMVEKLLTVNHDIMVLFVLKTAEQRFLNIQQLNVVLGMFRKKLLYSLTVLTNCKLC